MKNASVFDVNSASSRESRVKSVEDIGALVAQFDIPEFEYRSWVDEERSPRRKRRLDIHSEQPNFISARATLTDGVYVAQAETSSREGVLMTTSLQGSSDSPRSPDGGANGASGGEPLAPGASVPWDEPDDLKSPPLPILAGMRIRPGLLAELTIRPSNGVEAVAQEFAPRAWERVASLSQLDEAGTGSSRRSVRRGRHGPNARGRTGNSGDVEGDVAYPPLTRSARKASDQVPEVEDLASRVFKAASRGARPIGPKRSRPAAMGVKGKKDPAKDRFRKLLLRGTEDG